MKCGRWPPLGVCSQHLPGCDQPLLGKCTKGIGSGETWEWEPIPSSTERESNSPVAAVGVVEQQQPHVPPAPLPAALPAGGRREGAAAPVPPAQLTLRAKLGHVGLARVVQCPRAAEPGGLTGRCSSSSRGNRSSSQRAFQPWGSRDVCTIPDQALKPALSPPVRPGSCPECACPACGCPRAGTPLWGAGRGTSGRGSQLRGLRGAGGPAAGRGRCLPALGAAGTAPIPPSVTPGNCRRTPKCDLCV